MKELKDHEISIPENMGSSIPEPETQPLIQPGPVYRDTEQSKKKRFCKVWLPLVLNLLLCLLVALLVALKLNRYQALAYDWQPRQQPGDHYVLRVSDVTTLLSAGTTIIDFFGHMWTGMILWRCSFILLEKGGLKLKDLTQVLGGMPPFKRLQGLGWLVAIVLVTIFPQDYIEPLFSGSVNWNFALTYGPPVSVNTSYGALATGWYWYLTQEVTRQTLAPQAAGLASVLWNTGYPGEMTVNAVNSSNQYLGGITCRHVMPNAMPINSTIQNAILPCIEIHNITWPGLEAPDDISQYASAVGSSQLSIIGSKPLGGYNSGSAVLFSRKQPKWNTIYIVKYNDTASLASFPEATVWSGNMTVLLYVVRQIPSNGCTRLTTQNAFGNSSYLTDQVQGPIEIYSGSAESCLMYGTVYFTAGVIRAPKSKYVAPRVIEYPPTDEAENPPPASFNSEGLASAIEPSTWTREALFLMPDTMSSVALMNTSFMPTWDNINGYTASLIRHSYMANWDALHAAFDQDDAPILTARPAEQRLQASVSFIRLFTWLGVRLLLAISGILMWYMQGNYCKRGILVDELAVLFTDPTPITNKHPELTGMSEVTDEDNNNIGPLFLKQVKAGTAVFKIEE